MTPGHPSAAVGTKFEADGRLRPFPGLSVVSHIPQATPQHAALVALQGAIAAQPWADLFAILPASSLHVTLFDLICDEVRQGEHWSRLLPLDASLDEAEAFFRGRLPEICAETQIRFRLATLEDWQVTAKATLAPADRATAESLGDLRAHLSEASGVRHPSHDGYRFHCSLAYLLREPSPEECAAIDRFFVSAPLALGTLALPPATLVRFPDMGLFVPVD